MKTFLTALLILVPALILMFSAYRSFRQRMEGKSVRRVMRVNVATFLILIVAVSLCAFAVSAASEPVAAPAETVEAAPAAEAPAAADSGSSKGLGLLAAALVTAISGIGGGIAVAAGAPAAIAATSEDPKSFGKSLIFVALGESIALYGVVISILILNKV